MFSLILKVAAFILFGLSTIGVGAESPNGPLRFNLIPAGLACWVLGDLVGGHGH
jgi:hypothetical protein